MRELGAADGAKEGTLSSGARWWREEGKEYLEDGKVMTWTVIRGTSADGAVEWEEKFVSHEGCGEKGTSGACLVWLGWVHME